MKKFTMAIFLILLMVTLGACGGNTTSSSNDDGKKSGEVRTKVKGELKAEDYDNLFSDPNEYKGYKVELGGQVAVKPDKDDKGKTYFVMWGNPDDYSDTIYVELKNPKMATVKENQFVVIKGIVKGEDEYDGAPLILAENVEVADYITAVAPTIKEATVNQDIDQHGLVVTLQKIELAENQTRVYVKIKNNTSTNARIYSSSSKIVIGSQQFEEEWMDTEMLGLPAVQSDLLPNIETEGVMIFPAIDQNKESLKLYVEAMSDDYMLDFEPYVFDVKMD